MRDVNFSPNGKRLVAACGDHTARIWDVSTTERLDADKVERLTRLLGGAKLNPELGGLHVAWDSNRFFERQIIEGEAIGEMLHRILPMALGSDWRFIVDRTHPRDPRDCPVSPRMTVTVRQVSTSLIGTLDPGCIREARPRPP